MKQTDRRTNKKGRGECRYVLIGRQTAKKGKKGRLIGIKR